MSKVSIIIPCYNAAPWLAQTLDSALAQTWPETEIIVVDDGSTDNSREIARGYTRRGVRLLEGPQRNAAAARNRGILEAKGDFFQFLDADDLLAPDKISRQIIRAKESPTTTVFTGLWKRFHDNPERSYLRQDNPLFSNLSPVEYLQRYSSNDCMMHPAAWLIPRAIAEAAGSWDERLTLNDDGEYFARIVGASSHIAYCQDAVSYYRSSVPSSLSGQRSRKHLASAHLALTLITGHMLALENSAAMRQGAADLCQRFAYDYYPAGKDLIEDAQAKAKSLGGSTLQPLGGKIFQHLSSLIGWKLARQLQIHTGYFQSDN